MPPRQPSDLEIITEKIRRARAHLKLFEEKAGAYFKDCGAVMDIKVNPQMTKVFLCLTIETEPPAILSVLVGDCVHNARSALDNLVCALARTTDASTSCSGRQYPCFTEPGKYEAVRNDILKGVPEQARLLIDKMHPCADPKSPIAPKLHAVAILNTLSTRDKHRAPPLAAAYSRETTFTAKLPEGDWVLKLTGSLYSNVDMEIPFQSGLINHRDRVQCKSLYNLYFRDQAMFGDEPVLSLLTFSLDFVEQRIVASLKPFLDK